MRNRPREENNFNEFIDNLVLRAVYDGITSFDHLLCSLPGIYPSAVLDALRRLVAAGKISEQILSEAVECTSRIRNKPSDAEHGGSHSWKQDSMPVPHPLDFDWRFGERAIDHILKKCLELTAASDTVILLGTPGVLAEVKRRCYPRQVILFEKDRAVMESLIRTASKECVFKCDLTEDVLPQLTAKVVVCDSPWYMDYFESFIWAASRFCVLKGYLLLSVPPDGTRPNVKEEWAKIKALAERLGFSILKMEYGVLPYVTPPFERNALKAENLHNIPKEWRCSNLVVFTKEHEIDVPRLSKCSADGIWTEEVFDGIRIRFSCRRNGDDFRDPTLKRIVSGDILPSVSRWDERRKQAEVWTSGNRIFRCRGPDLLQRILRALVRGLPPEKEIASYIGRKLSPTETDLVVKASEQIANVIKAELDEYMA